MHWAQQKQLASMIVCHRRQEYINTSPLLRPLSQQKVSVSGSGPVED
jgi:hypothetical protein